MSDNNKNRRKHKKVGGKSFLILPIVFFVGIYTIFYFVLAPHIPAITSSIGLFFSDSEKNYSTEYKNIFVPVAENTDDNKENDDKENMVSIVDIQYPIYGQQFGELVIEDCDINCKLFFGDGNVSLRNGVGTYLGSFIPGYGKTILVAGHNNTYFNALKNAEKGQLVKIKTSYGNYTYKITETAVKKATDSSAYDLSADYENLILYTCYPFDELGLTPKRFFVYAEYVSGPKIDKETGVQ